jgi:hypothetical protein
MRAICPTYLTLPPTQITGLFDQPTETESHLKHSVLTSKKTQPITITKINWLTLFKEIIAVNSENHMKPIHSLCGQNAELLILKAGGT